MKILFNLITTFHIIIFISSNQEVCFKSRECLKDFYFNKSILFYSKHEGTANEMISILESRKINYTINTEMALFLKEKFQLIINKSIAKSLIEEDFFKKSCNTFDLIIISDVLSLGRPFFQASPNKCKSKIILQITTRFDWGHKYDEEYIYLFKSLVNNPNIYWQINNEYEKEFLNSKGIFPKEQRFWLIKPIGKLLKINVSDTNTVESSKIIIFNKYFEHIEYELKKIVPKLKLKCNFFDGQNYGGPNELAKQKLFVYFPYQFSTMKVFENAFAGVITAIPTPRFFLEVLRPAYKKSNHRNQEQLIKMSKSFTNWTEYVDVYKKRYIQMYIQFDSFEELAKLIDGEIQINREHYRNVRKKIMSEHEIEQNQRWDQFLKSIF